MTSRDTDRHSLYRRSILMVAERIRLRLPDLDLGDERGRLGSFLGPLALAVLLATPVATAALFHVWANVTSVRLGYGLSRASEEHRALIEENRGLRVELEVLRAQRRLERLAAERLDLAAPRSEQIVRVRSGGAR